MENTYSEFDNLNLEPGIELDEDAISSINEIRKWTMFFAILGFIFIGFIAFGGLIYAMFFASLGSALYDLPVPAFVFAFFYLVIAAIYFFPILYLYKFSVSTKKALASKEPEDMSIAFYYLKSHYKFIGVLTIVVIIMYILMLVALIPIGLMMGSI